MGIDYSLHRVLKEFNELDDKPDFHGAKIVEEHLDDPKVILVGYHNDVSELVDNINFKKALIGGNNFGDNCVDEDDSLYNIRMKFKEVESSYLLNKHNKLRERDIERAQDIDGKINALEKADSFQIYWMYCDNNSGILEHAKNDIKIVQFMPIEYLLGGTTRYFLKKNKISFVAYAENVQAPQTLEETFRFCR